MCARPIRSVPRAAAATFLLMMSAFETAAAIDLKNVRAILTRSEAPPAHIRLAADTLSRYLEKMAGVRLPVDPAADETSAGKQSVILVGRTAAIRSGAISADELERVAYDGFVLRVTDGRAALAGYADHGTVYAVYAFLERLGYRWYAWDCERVPVLKDTRIEDFSVSDKPAMTFRRGFPWQLRGTPMDLIGDPMQVAKEEGLKLKIWYDHTAGFLVPRPLYYEKHREYYSQQLDGTRRLTRDVDSYVHLCLSNPDVVQLTRERALAWIRKQRERRFFWVDQGDGHDWCQCEQCRAMDVAPGVYADRLLKWVNHIARAVRQEFPDKVLLTIAYCGSDQPPLQQRPEKNVWVFYCPYWGVALSMAHPLTHDLNREAREQFLGWRRAAPDNLAVFDYNLGYIPSWNAMADKTKWYAANGAKGIWPCGQPKCFNALFAYTIAKLEWNPTLDPQALKREFVHAYYGPAAPHIRRYLALVERCVSQGGARGLHSGASPASFYPYPAIRDMLAALEDALQAAGANATLCSRIRKERDLMVRDYHEAVVLATPGLSAEARQFALSRFKESLRVLLDRCVARAAQIDATPADSAGLARLEQQQTQDLRLLRGTLAHFAGLKLPQGTDPLAVARRFLKDHEAAIAAYPKTKQIILPKPIEGGLLLPAAAFQGGYFLRNYGWFCSPAKDGVAVYAPRAPRPSAAQVEFTLENAPLEPSTLLIDGQDSTTDLPPPAQIRIILNDRAIYEGDCGFVKRGWSQRTFPVSEGALKAGRNVLAIRNVTKHTQRLDGWWFMLSEARLLFREVDAHDTGSR